MAEVAPRVLLVLGTSSGGTGRHVGMLAEGLAGEGHQIVVAGPAGTDEAFRFSGLARFAEVPIADRPHPARDLCAASRLRRLAAGADVVHAHGLRAGALAAVALLGRRVPLVVTLHNALTASGAIAAIYGVLARIVAKRADQVLVVSPDLGDRMVALGARRVGDAVVPAPPLGRPGRTVAEVRAELGAGERPILLTIARLAQQKGLETLLEVARGPYGPGEPVPLFVVAGEGPLRPRLQGRIDAEGLPVLLLGERTDVADLLQAAGALLMPSRWEGQPLNVQEALRAGTPIIATAVGGVPGMVGDAALLVPPGDAAAMRREVGRLLADPGLSARLSAAAAARPLPDRPAAVEAVRAVYRAVLA